MIISYDKQFMAFQPWKSAGSTLYKRLERFNESPYSRFYYFNEHLQRVVHQHVTVADFKAMPEAQLGLKKIAFTRNPYDRVYSGFIQIQRDLKEQPGLPYPEPWIREQVIEQLSVNEQRLERAGYDFDRWVTLLDDDDIYDITRNSSFPLYPAHYWTHDGDAQFVDFIGKVENFEDDFVKMLEFLDIKEGYNLENDNVSELPGPGYRYIGKMSQASIERINGLFAKDFELFEYEMKR